MSSYPFARPIGREESVCHAQPCALDVRVEGKCVQARVPWCCSRGAQVPHTSPYCTVSTFCMHLVLRHRSSSRERSHHLHPSPFTPSRGAHHARPMLLAKESLDQLFSACLPPFSHVYDHVLPGRARPSIRLRFYYSKPYYPF
jgi:hypothetical protein